MGSVTTVNILCFNTSLWKGGNPFDRNRGVAVSIREVEQKANSERFSEFMAAQISHSTNAGVLWSTCMSDLQAVVGSLFRDYCARVRQYRGADRLGILRDINFWERTVSRCLFGRSALPGVFNTDIEKRCAIRNGVILHARELVLRKMAEIADIDGYSPGVIPFDFWKQDSEERPEREGRLVGANRECCAGKIETCQRAYVRKYASEGQYSPNTPALKSEAEKSSQLWNSLFRDYTSRISERRPGRDETVRSRMFWFIAACNAVSGISGTIGCTPADLRRFEFNHAALWMPVSKIGMEFLQDMAESPLQWTAAPSRGSRDIVHYINEGARSTGQILEALHDLLEGKGRNEFRKGKEVAKVVRAAHAAGLLTSCPVPYSAMHREFPHIGAESGYYKYFEDVRLRSAEFQPLTDMLKEFAKGR